MKLTRKANVSVARPTATIPPGSNGAAVLLFNEEIADDIVVKIVSLWAAIMV
jgi:hypothetical protein